MSGQLNITNKWMRPHCWYPKTNNGQWQTFYQLCLLHWPSLCRAMLSPFSRGLLFVTPWTVARQAPRSRGFSRQEHWSGLLCPPPGDFPSLGMEPVSLMPTALAGRFFTTGSTWETLGLSLGSSRRSDQRDGAQQLVPIQKASAKSKCSVFFFFLLE